MLTSVPFPDIYLLMLIKKDEVEEADGGGTGTLSRSRELLGFTEDVSVAVFLPARLGVGSGPRSCRAVLPVPRCWSPSPLCSCGSAATAARTADSPARAAGRPRASAASPPAARGGTAQTHPTTMSSPSSNFTLKTIDLKLGLYLLRHTRARVHTRAHTHPWQLWTSTLLLTKGSRIYILYHKANIYASEIKKQTLT